MEPQKTARWQDLVTFGEEHPQPHTLAENEHVRVMIAGLKPGQHIPVHPEAAAVYTFLEGKGIMTVNDQSFAVEQGSVIVTEKGAGRGMSAETRLVFIAVRMA